MKPKKEEKWSAVADRYRRGASLWAGWSSLLFLVWVLLVGVTVNGLEVHGMPRQGWVVMLFALTTLLAFLWYSIVRFMEKAYNARVQEIKEAAADYAAFLRVFMPTHEEVNVRLAWLAHLAKEACDAERNLYERGADVAYSERGRSDPEEALAHASAEYVRKLAAAKHVVKMQLAAFWDLHRLVRQWLPYQLLDSWKPYTSIATQPKKSERTGPEVYAEGMNEPLDLVPTRSIDPTA